MTSPTARSLKKLRDEGWTAEVVEKWISYRPAKLDARLWELVDDFLNLGELAAATDECDVEAWTEKWQRWTATIQPIRELRKLYKPPAMPGIRRDPFGFADILAFRGSETMIVQATSFTNLNARIAKAQGLADFHKWIRGGRLVEFHGWRVRKLKRGDGSTCKVVRFPESGRDSDA